MSKVTQKTVGHTPGPWVATGGYTPTVKAGEVLIAVPGSRADELGGRSLAELTANARLIASAPDLLAACWVALKRMQGSLAIRVKLTGITTGAMADEVKLIEAVLTKATGEGE